MTAFKGRLFFDSYNVAFSFSTFLTLHTNAQRFYNTSCHQPQSDIATDTSTMEDLEGAPGSPALIDEEEPQGNNDPRDPLNPGLEEEDRPNAPLGEPTADVDAFGDDEAPETVGAMNDAEEEAENSPTPGGDDDDDDQESELEELDETQFQDFDPSALEIPAKPVAVDESNVALLGVHKRKRTEEEERERKKKKKEGKREKPKKKKKTDGDDDFVGGEEIEGKRARKGKVGADGRTMKNVRRARTPEDELENLTPDERELSSYTILATHMLTL